MDRVKKRQIKNKVKKETGLQRKRIFHYAAGLFGLIGLVAAAFWVPQFVFRVQDDILCGNTVFGQRIHMDVEAMRTDYEKELAIRLKNFADGLKTGENFYVTSQDLEINEEIQAYLYSDSGLYQSIIDDLTAIGLLDFWRRDYTVNQWKRYVIYSDNYAKGVNFILWYIELQDPEEVLKLLVDGEDGTIYALKTKSSLPEEEQSKVHYDYWNQLEEYLGGYMFFELWGYFANYYDLMTVEVSRQYYAWLEAIEKGMTKTRLQTEISVLDAKALTDGEEIGVEIEEVVPETESEDWNAEEWYAMEGENRMILRMPCGENSLEAVVEIVNPEYGYSLPNVTIGILNIYERIPEF